MHRVQQRAGEGGVDHGPDAETGAEQERAGKDRDGDHNGRESRKGEAIESVQYRCAVGGDAGDEDDGQKAVEETDGEFEAWRAGSGRR